MSAITSHYNLVQKMPVLYRHLKKLVRNISVGIVNSPASLRHETVFILQEEKGNRA